MVEGRRPPSFKGKHHTKAAIEKIRQAALEREASPFKGKHHTKAAIEKIRKAALERPAQQVQKGVPKPPFSEQAIENMRRGQQRRQQRRREQQT